MKFFGKSPRSPNADRGGGPSGQGGGGAGGGQQPPGSNAGGAGVGGQSSLGAGGEAAGGVPGQSLAGPSSTSLQAPGQGGLQGSQRASNPLQPASAGFVPGGQGRQSAASTVNLVRSELSADEADYRRKTGSGGSGGAPIGTAVSGPGGSQQQSGAAGNGGSSGLLGNGSSGISRRFSRRGRDGNSGSGQEYSAYHPPDSAGRPTSMLSQNPGGQAYAPSEVGDDDNGLFTQSLKRAATAAAGGTNAQPQYHAHPGLQVDGPPSGRPSMEMHGVGLAVSREPSMMGPPSGQAVGYGITGVVPGSPMPPQTPQTVQTAQGANAQQTTGGSAPNQAQGAASNTYQGQAAPPYDPAKFEGQPLGRMTPPGSSRGNAQQLNPNGGDQPGSAGQQPLAVTPSHPPGPGHPEYEVLQQKYRKVKSLYFEGQHEIERLQNAIAQHRLSTYRSSLDDSEYTSRFDRLNGAIKNVSYEIRQSWISLPSWLAPYLPLSPGGREMTAVGRAAISRWVVDEIFERFFHPALDPSLSYWLKNIEYNIRKVAPAPQSVADDDDLNNKVSTWRLTTLDALQEMLSSPRANELRKTLTEHLADKLTSKLKSYLRDPPPQGLGSGVHMLVEIAIGLACHLPLESRAVKVWYPHPGQRFDATYMKNEGSLPGPEKEEKKEEKKGEEKKEEEGIRVAGFMAVEVRGRSILVKAPVWM